MATITVNGQTVDRNEEGFLTDPSSWSEDVAKALADEAHIELSPRHWDVLTFCRQDFEKTGKSPGVRRITKVGKIPTKEMYALFPGGPGKLSAKLAGLAKPTSCL